MIPFDFEKAIVLIDEVLDNYSEIERVLEGSIRKIIKLSEKNAVCVKEVFGKLD